MTFSSLILTLALLGQADDILADEAKAGKGVKPAPAPAAAPANPSPAAPKAGEETEPTAGAAAAAKGTPGGKVVKTEAAGEETPLSSTTPPLCASATSANATILPPTKTAKPGGGNRISRSASRGSMTRLTSSSTPTDDV